MKNVLLGISIVMVIILVTLGTVFAAQQDVVSVIMDSPTSTQNLNVDDYFQMTCSAVLAGRGGPPAVTYTGEWCDSADCSGSVNTLAVGTPTSDVVSLESGAQNPESLAGTYSWNYLAYARNGGSVYVRCKVAGGASCAGGCYSATQQVSVASLDLFSVTAETFQDSGYTKYLKFFENGDTVYVESEVLHNDFSPCTDCAVSADFKIGEAVQDSITLTHTSNGIYRGGWVTDMADTNDVYTVSVEASKGPSSISSQNNIHLYSGNGVSAYTFDFDGDGNSDMIMENQHLVAVYYDTNPLTYFYQKDENMEYTFKNIAQTTGRGGIESNDRPAVLLGMQLSQTGESLTEVILDGDAEFRGVDNEVLITGYNDITVWEYNGVTQDYEIKFSMDPGFESTYSRIGDVDNDGLNEVVTFHRNYFDLAILDYNPGTNNLETLWSDVLSYRITGLSIGNLDDDPYTEFVIADYTTDQLILFYSDTPNAQSFSSTVIATLPDYAYSIEVGNMDDDPEDEIFAAVYNLGIIKIFDYDSGSGNYVNIADINTVATTNDDMGFGDVTGDGRNNLISCGNSKGVEVFEYDNGNYNSIYFSGDLGGFTESCSVVDTDADGVYEFFTSAVYTADPQLDHLIFFEHQGGVSFANTWNSTEPYTNMISVGPSCDGGDIDGDGYEDMVAPAYDSQGSKLVGYTGGSSPPFSRTLYEDRVLNSYGVVIGDVDNDAGSQAESFHFSIKMGSEEVDYLQYQLSTLNLADTVSLLSPLSGSVDSSIDDDRYHLQTGEDGLVTTLASGQWNNFAGSNYVAVYDSSSASDPADNSVISWIRFTETAGVTFDDVGLWNGVAEGLRIRYDLSSATLSDEINYLLAFTTGTYSTIHPWMSTVEGGQLPPVNFMTPIEGIGVMSVDVFAPLSGSDYDINTGFTAEASVSCSEGDCGDVSVKLQYCEGAGCTDWQDVGPATPIVSSTPVQPCSANLLENTQCSVAWQVHGTNGGEYRLNAMAMSDISASVIDDTPNTVYINELQVVIDLPIDGLNVNLDEQFTMSGTATCLGLSCGTVSVTAQDKETGTWQASGTGSLDVIGANPYDCGVSSPCPVSWTLSSSIAQDYLLRIVSSSATLDAVSEERLVHVLAPNPALDVSVVTDKDVYYDGDTIFSTTTVRDHLSVPVVDADVTVTIYMSDMSVAKTCIGLSQSGGLFECNHRFKNKDPAGTWTVSSDATKTGYDPGHGETTIQVV